ncbi:MAG: alpha/beta hydrolase [Armatimonadota bacterium]
MATAGPVPIETFDCTTLRGNPLGDPSVRPIPVYLPPGYGANSDRRYPVIYWLHGFTGTALSQINASPWVPSIPQVIDRVIDEGSPPAIVVMADGWTRYGGSQFLNSSATGRYEDAIAELVGFIDGRYRTLASPDHRGIAGKSSGGYGALALGMRHPDLFGGLASLSGDIYFEACFKVGFWHAIDTIRHHGSLTAFLDAFVAAPKKTEEMIRTLGTTVAMAMAYSPNPASPHGFDLPIDLDTGRIDEAVWARWQQWDPVFMADRYVENLKAMRLVYFECGSRDQYNSHHGARMLHRRLEQLGIRHEYQEFDDDHSSTNYRYVESFRRLCAALHP